MPSFQDSAVIFFLALLLFGPRKLPELARQLGKLMGEFRRASNEFRMQMEDELRQAEQADKQKKIEAIEAATPSAAIPSTATPSLAAPALTENTIAAPAQSDQSEPVATAAVEDPMDVHPHLRPIEDPPPPPDRSVATAIAGAQSPQPVPISSAGDLHLMPPATGLPVARRSVSSDLSPVLAAIPHTPAPAASGNGNGAGEVHAGTVSSGETVTHG